MKQRMQMISLCRASLNSALNLNERKNCINNCWMNKMRARWKWIYFKNHSSRFAFDENCARIRFFFYFEFGRVFLGLRAEIPDCSFGNYRIGIAKIAFGSKIRNSFWIFSNKNHHELTLNIYNFVNISTSEKSPKDQKVPKFFSNSPSSDPKS